MLKGLDLFSGIGGISLALNEWVRPIAYCEIDPYCQAVLLSRMASNELQVAPIWDNIINFNARNINVRIDIIYGGFPCQGISVAGLGKGLEDERSGLFFEIVRLAKEVKPTFIFLENTKGILSNGGIEVIETLTSIGYSCRWITKSCKEVGSPQNRERWFCLAYANSESNKGLSSGEEAKISKFRKHFKPKEWDDWPADKPKLLGMANDLPFRMDRARALGNSVCVSQCKEAFKILMGL